MLRNRYPRTDLFALIPQLELRFEPQLEHLDRLLDDDELVEAVREDLARRIETREDLERHVAAWEEERNERGDQIKWRFTTADARIKLRRLYPTL
jgi:hypothetical protein